jgi:hypothetical protein
VVALHGGAVAYGGRAWVVIGASGAGKSSTTRALLERGAKIVSDDMVLLDAVRGLALPGAPTLRLWAPPEAGARESAPIVGLEDKRWYRMEDAMGCLEPQPIGAIVVLTPTPGAPESGRLEPVTGMAALVAMLAQAFDLERPIRPGRARGWRGRACSPRPRPCGRVTTRAQPTGSRARSRRSGP